MRAEWRNATFAAGLLAAAVAQTFAQSASLAADKKPHPGKDIYERRCALCHGPDGSPQESVAKMLQAEIPHLGSPRVQSKSDAEIQKVVKDGAGKMKAMKGIADMDITNIIAFMRTFKKP